MTIEDPRTYSLVAPNLRAICERHGIVTARRLAATYNSIIDRFKESPISEDDALAMWTGSRDYAVKYLLGIAIALHLTRDELAELFA